MSRTGPSADQDTALSILTRLQQGVPPEPDDIPYVRVGREDEEHRLCDKPTEGLQSVQRGSGQIFFVLGDFGYGKSFFINLLAHRATEMNMVRSRFDIQDIQDIASKNELYTSIVRNLRYPDQPGEGLVPLLRQFCEEVDRSDFDRVATQRGFYGHSIYNMLSRLLDAWETGRLRVERDDITLDQSQVLTAVASYLQGEDVPLEMLHAIGKVGFDHISKEDQYEYLQHIRSLVRELGYEGVVVLLDEAAEQLEWSPDSGTTQRLIDLYNKCYQQGKFDHMMFVFVGNQEKWDSLIEETGHQALSDRYGAKKVVLKELSEEDYVDLVMRVGELVTIGYDRSVSFTEGDARGVVTRAADEYGGISALSPRRILLSPRGTDDHTTLVDLITGSP